MKALSIASEDILSLACPEAAIEQLCALKNDLRMQMTQSEDAK